MDTFSFVPSAPISHNVELYSARFLVQGAISGPFKRTSDLLNHRERRYVTVDGATITPVGQQSEGRKLSTSLMMSKGHIHVAATAPQEPSPQSQPQAPGPPNREFYVQKTIFPCYALTDTYIIFGQCHLRQGTNLETLLELSDTFVPITNPTVSLLGRPSASWKRELVLVNKEALEVMYLVEG
jgi:hypothetical protein